MSKWLPHRTRVLRVAARAEIRRLEHMLAATPCIVLLVDAQGRVVHASLPAGRQDGRARQVAALRRATAPIVDIHGELAGILDLSVEHPRAFGFEPGALVGLHAAAIERALRVAQSPGHMLVELHVHPHLLGTPASGLVGIDAAGRVAWLDARAERLMGPRGDTARAAGDCERLLGASLAELQRLSGQARPAALCLLNGLQVWAAVRPGRCSARC